MRKVYGINQTQGLGNTPFSLSHKVLLDRVGRLRVAKQLVAILKDYLFGDKILGTLTILDIGCSSGIITQYIADQAKKTIGVDVDLNAISLAKRSYEKKPSLTFRVASGSNLPFKDNSFDVVICNQVYSYVSTPGKLMNEVYRVLKDNGVCLFTGDNLLRPIEPLYNLPFFRLLPTSLAKWILGAMGHKNVYIGSYKTYWGIKKLCNQFRIYDYTIRVLKESARFKYEKFNRYKDILKIVPEILLKVLEPFFPSFVFILKKDKNYGLL